MARPSKLTAQQWAEIEKRHMAGEGIRALAREYNINPSNISTRVSKQVKAQKALAKQIATTEMTLARLPVSQQITVRSLADDLKSISANLAGAANLGAETAHRLASIAKRQVESINHKDGTEKNTEKLKLAAVLNRTANEAAHIGLSLLAANKDMAKADEPKEIIPDSLPDDDIEATRIYLKIIQGR